MTLKYADRVFETSTTTGTGTINLSGPVTSYQSFIDGVGTGGKVPYCIKDGLNWEVGIGTVTAGTPDTLSRDFIIDSSNSGNAVDWGAGQRDVFLVASNILQFLRDENLNDTNEIAVSSSGTGSAHIATPFVTPIAFSDRMIVRWRAPATNPDGDGITLDWGGLGAKPYVNNDATDFATGVIQAGSIQEAVYNLAQDRFERTSPIYPATPPADMVSYDNTTSGLTANDVQDAIDEVVGSLGTAAYEDVATGGTGDLLREDGDGSALTGIERANWELVDTIVISSPVSAVTIEDLDEYRDVIIMSIDVTASSRGDRRIRVSANNGSSFLTEFLPTDSATRQEWNTTSSGSGATAARSGGTAIYNFNTTDPVKPVLPLGRAGITSVSIAVASASVLNCVQVANSAGDLTGGTIYVFGRK